MLPFDYCCSSVSKELKKRTCKICNQYIPSAYRMKNHYKIHAEHYEDFDHDQDDISRMVTDDTENKNEYQSSTAASGTKTEILDWLQSDFEDINLGSTSSQLKNDRVQETNDRDDEDKNTDWIHVE